MRLLVELVFEMHVFSMELRSFEKPYGTLLNSAKWATGGLILLAFPVVRRSAEDVDLKFPSPEFFPKKRCFPGRKNLFRL